jgi:hypothetical protein
MIRPKRSACASTRRRPRAPQSRRCSRFCCGKVRLIERSSKSITRRKRSDCLAAPRTCPRTAATSRCQSRATRPTSIWRPPRAELDRLDALDHDCSMSSQIPPPPPAGSPPDGAASKRASAPMCRYSHGALTPVVGRAVGLLQAQVPITFAIPSQPPWALHASGTPPDRYASPRQHFAVRLFSCPVCGYTELFDSKFFE